MHEIGNNVRCLEPFFLFCRSRCRCGSRRHPAVQRLVGFMRVVLINMRARFMRVF